MNLPGAKEHELLTEQWLQGKIDIPEIEEKWVKGPAVPIQIIAPERVKPGEEVGISVVLTNNKPGHDFPTGPIDIIQGWVEIIVTDQSGREVFASGKVDEQNFIQPGSFVFKVEPVDQYGNLIDKHNLWEMVGVRFNRSMFPGFSDQANFSFSCPAEVDAQKRGSVETRQYAFDTPKEEIVELHIVARLNYRKINQFLVNYLFGEDSGITTPITVISSDEKTIKIIPDDTAVSHASAGENDLSASTLSGSNRSN